MLVNRPEFHLADLAVVTAGGTPFSIYQTYTPDQIAYVVSDSGAKVVITEHGVPPGRAGGARAAARTSST